MKTVTTLAEAQALGDVKIYKDAEDSYRCYFPGEIQEPVIVENPVPQEVTVLQALLAIDQAGMSPAYEAWANDPARTFAEKAFINRAQVWRRTDPLMIAGATALGLSPAQLDDLFMLAATL